MPARQPARRGATDKDSSVLNSLLFATIFRESAEARASQVAEKRSMGMKTCQGTDSSVPLSCWKWTTPICRRRAERTK